VSSRSLRSARRQPRIRMLRPAQRHLTLMMQTRCRLRSPLVDATLPARWRTSPPPRRRMLPPARMWMPSIQVGHLAPLSLTRSTCPDVPLRLYLPRDVASALPNWRPRLPRSRRRPNVSFRAASLLVWRAPPLQCLRKVGRNYPARDQLRAGHPGVRAL